MARPRLAADVSDKPSWSEQRGVITRHLPDILTAEDPLVEPTRNERFESLFRDHYAAVRGYALRRAPRDMAPDVVAETFLVAWRRLDDVPADALPWLYGVARRVLANARRSADRGLSKRNRWR